VIRVTDAIAIDEAELRVKAVRASGPGGQHVNKVATAAQLRFDVAGSPSLPPAVKDRVARLAGSRMTAEGVLILGARRFRSQERNRQDAVERLLALLRRAATPPTPRRKTRPTAASGQRRLAEKRQQRLKKQRRQAAGPDD
jgi:ribosome-associated protein